METMDNILVLLAQLSEGQIASIVGSVVTVLGAITLFLQKNKLLEYLEKRRKDRLKYKKDKLDDKTVKYAIKHKALKDKEASETLKELTKD